MLLKYNVTSLTLYSAKVIIMPRRIIWSWYTGRWRVGCYIWYCEEGTGRGPSPPRPLLAVPNLTVHLSTASVPSTVLQYNGPLLCHQSVKTNLAESVVCNGDVGQSVTNENCAKVHLKRVKQSTERRFSCGRQIGLINVVTRPPPYNVFHQQRDIQWQRLRAQLL